MHGSVLGRDSYMHDCMHTSKFPPSPLPACPTVQRPWTCSFSVQKKGICSGRRRPQRRHGQVFRMFGVKGICSIFDKYHNVRRFHSERKHLVETCGEHREKPEDGTKERWEKRERKRGRSRKKAREWRRRRRRRRLAGGGGTKMSKRKIVKTEVCIGDTTRINKERE